MREWGRWLRRSIEKSIFSSCVLSIFLCLHIWDVFVESRRSFLCGRFSSREHLIFSLGFQFHDSGFPVQATSCDWSHEPLVLFLPPPVASDFLHRSRPDSLHALVRIPVWASPFVAVRPEHPVGAAWARCSPVFVLEFPVPQAGMLGSSPISVSALDLQSPVPVSTQEHGQCCSVLIWFLRPFSRSSCNFFHYF
jgi:hypothetical protein